MPEYTGRVRLRTRPFPLEIGGEAAVLAERQAGRDRYGVRGTPTLMLADGAKLRAPLAEPRLRSRRIVGIGRLPCYGDDCLDATRSLFERALASGLSGLETSES